MRAGTLVIIVIILALIVAIAAGSYVAMHQAPAAQGQDLNTTPEPPGSSPGGGRIDPSFSSSPG